MRPCKEVNVYTMMAAKIFTTVKIMTITKNKDIINEIEENVILAHEAHKRCTFFLRLFCLNRGEVPQLNRRNIKMSLNLVSFTKHRGRPKTKECDVINFGWKFQYNLPRSIRFHWKRTSQRGHRHIN